MVSLLLAGGLSLLVTLFGTPIFVKFLKRKSYGQCIR